MRVALSLLLSAGLAVVVARTLQASGALADYTVLISIAALLCCLVLAAAHVRGRAAAGPAVGAMAGLSRAALVRLAAFAAVWVAYVLVLPSLGFVLSTWLVLVLSLSLMRGRPTLAVVFGTALFVLVFAVLIKAVLYVPVPQGALDTWLDELLYGYFKGGDAS